MKTLLTAIKAQLQQDLSYVRASDVFITEDEHMIPEAVKFPAIGIKDGAVDWSIMSAGPSKQQAPTVTVIAYVQLVKDEASVMGDDATGKKGVLEIIDDVRTSLDENTLSDEVSSAEIVSESASELFADETEAIQKKSAVFRYERWNV